MDDFQISVNVPLDSDGFLRRECPSCGRQFKWRAGEESGTAEPVAQYFCPLCGQPASADAWATTAQVEHAKAAVMPEAMRRIGEMLEDSFRGNKNVTFKANADAGSDEPVPDALHEPDDMVIVEPPCHPEEPLKVPEGSVAPFHCLVCGSPFAA